MPDPNQQANQENVGQSQDTPVVDPQVVEAQLRENVINSVKETLPAEPAQAQPPATTDESQKDQSGSNANRMALQIARLEKQIREQKAASDKTREEHEALINALKDPDKRYEVLENQFGATYQDWTERLVSGSKPQRDQKDIEIDQLKSTVQELVGRLDKREEGEQQQHQSQATEKARKYASDYLETNKDKYPYLHLMQRGDLLIQEAVKRANDGVMVTEDVEAELAAEAEENFVKLIKSDLSTLTKLEVFDKLMAEYGYQKTAQRVPETEQTQRDTEGKYETKTLTNDLSGKPSSGFDYINATDEELRDHARKTAKEAAEAERRRQNT